MHVLVPVLKGDLMPTRADEQAVSVAERRLLCTQLAKGQLGKQRNLMRVGPVYFGGGDFAFASCHGNAMFFFCSSKSMDFMCFLMGRS